MSLGGAFLGELKHSMIHALMDAGRNMTNDEFKMSCDEVNEVLLEIVETTAKHFEENASDTFTDNKCSNNLKQESSGNDTNGDGKDLPVRRSSRIKHLTVKQNSVGRKKHSKQSKGNKVLESKVKEENHSSAVKEESVQIGIEIGNSDQLTNIKGETPDSNKSSKDEASKSQKANKRAQKRIPTKSEKDDLKAEKLKVDKKKASNRKKKQSLTESIENSIDKVIEDVINSSLLSQESDTVPEKPYCETLNTTSCVVVIDNLSNEIQVPEIPNNSTKQTDNQDCKDKELESKNLKPVKVKSRWWRSSELEGVLNTEQAIPVLESVGVAPLPIVESIATSELIKDGAEDLSNLSQNENSAKELANVSISTTEKPVYDHIEENIYRFARKKSKSKKQVRRMVCDCTLTKEEVECGMLGCKEECLNRLLMIECGYRCPIGEACSNKKFQKKQYVKAEIIKTEKKGWGLRTLEHISKGDFLMEFVGEVLNHKEYRQRVKLYAKEKNVHSYFMALKTDEILDATSKGNLTRFINHSCDPNCETQKWTVNGELRVGVFAKRAIPEGEEFTLDYKFQRYGREAQKCFCGSDNCSGYIGGAKQISIDAYSGIKSATTKKKKGSDDKKRDYEDMALEEEIEKLNSTKGLRNREETLKLARLMVRADESITRHQLLDIIIKTEEQACLRLFLDYHGLPLLWSWMTDIVDLDLKAKILQVLTLLPISNKTMLLDSKVMSVVEKWVQENTDKKEQIEKKASQSLLTSPEEGSEPQSKKLKNIEFSDSETDSTGSHNATDNSSENSTSLAENNFRTEEILSESLTSEPFSENKSPDDFQHSKMELKEDDPQLNLKTSISDMGCDLLNCWKNLKEVFRIPRLEQQKRKEDELEADHNIHVCAKTEEKKPVVEVTGDQIQVLISGKTPSFSDNLRTYPYDNPELNYKMDDRSHSTLLSVPQSNNKIKKRPFIPKSKLEDLSQRKMKEDSDSSVEAASPILSNTSPILPSSGRPVLLPTPAFVNQPPINFPPPINPSVAPHPHLEQAPPTMYPPQIVYPQPQVPFVNTGAPPPVLPHPPVSMPPPSAVMPQASPILTHPPNANIPSCQPVNTGPGLMPNPVNFQLPPNIPPSSAVPGSSPFIPNQNSGLPNYPPAPNPFTSQNQPFYFMQQPPAIPSSTPQATFPENVGVQSVAPMGMRPVNPLQMPPTSFPMPSSTAVPIPVSSLPMQTPTSMALQPTTSVPMQPITSLPMQPGTSVPMPATTNAVPVETVLVQNESPVVKEEPKPVKLPKMWRSATDSEGNVYYYHSVTRQTQWDPPNADEAEDDSDDEDSESEESESSDTPTYDEPKVINKHSRRKSKKRKTTKAAADTSVSINVRPEVAKKIKELFRTKMSSYIVHCLNAYRKPDCKIGRITSNEDFKYLARKLTHYTMTKELKQCKNVEDLDCNECVMHKARDFIKKYMSKYGSKYSRKERYSPPDA